MAWNPPKTIQHTLDDWLATPENDGNRYELIDGRIVVTAPGNSEHQSLIGQLNYVLITWAKTFRLGVMTGECAVILPGEQVVIPDVTMLLIEHVDRRTKLGIEGPPDLVVEILSPSTRERDLKDKRAIYERAGVPEYWLVDPESRTLTCLVLTQGQYKEAAVVTERLVSPTIPHLEFDVRDIFSLF